MSKDKASSPHKDSPAKDEHIVWQSADKSVTLCNPPLTEAEKARAKELKTVEDEPSREAFLLFSPYLSTEKSAGCCVICGRYAANIYEMTHTESCRAYAQARLSTEAIPGPITGKVMPPKEGFCSLCGWVGNLCKCGYTPKATVSPESIERAALKWTEVFVWKLRESGVACSPEDQEVFNSIAVETLRSELGGG